MYMFAISWYIYMYMFAISWILEVAGSHRRKAASVPQVVSSDYTAGQSLPSKKRAQGNAHGSRDEMEVVCNP